MSHQHTTMRRLPSFVRIMRLGSHASGVWNLPWVVMPISHGWPAWLSPRPPHRCYATHREAVAAADQLIRDLNEAWRTSDVDVIEAPGA